MEERTFSKTRGFMCKCMNVFVSEHQIQQHLDLPLNHVFSKPTPPQSVPKDLKESISKKIDIILKIQAQVQQASVKIVQTITKNTANVIQNLQKITKFYKQILFETPYLVDHTLKQTEVVSTFQINNQFHQALSQHFQQNPIAQKWTIQRLIQNAKTQITDIYQTNNHAIYCMVVSSDESFIATGGLEGAIRVWDLKINSQMSYFKKHKGMVRSIALGSGDELLLSGSADYSVRLWNLMTKTQVCNFKSHAFEVYSVAISRDNKTGYSGSGDGSVKIWNLDLKKIKFTLWMGFTVLDICLFDEGKTLAAVGHHGSITCIDTNTIILTEIQKNKEVHINCIEFSKCGKYFITGYQDGKIEIWSTANSKLLFEQKKHSGEINKIEFFADSNLFASCSEDGKVLIWDFKSKSLVDSITEGNPLRSVCFLKNAQSLAFFSDNIKFYRLNLKITETKINFNFLNSECISISSNLRFLAYGTYEIALYDLEKCRKISKMPQYRSKCCYLRFSSDNCFLGCGYLLGEIYILTVPELVLEFSYQPSLLSSIKCLRYSRSKRLIGFGTKEVTMIQSIDKKEVLYEHAIKSIAAEFCLNDEKFVYVDRFVVHIVNKYFIHEAAIENGFRVDRLVCIDNNENLTISWEGNYFSVLNLFTNKKLFHMKNRKEFKEWVADKKEQKYQAIAKLSGVIFS